MSDLTLDNSVSHHFKLKYFVNPTLCNYCKDFIWGSGCIGYECRNCLNNVHGECKIFYRKTECTLAILKTFESIDKLDVTQWPSKIVREWLLVTNLHRYLDLFTKENIDGKALINLNKEKLEEMRVKDTFHQDAIMNAIDELKRRSILTREDLKRSENDTKTRLQNGSVFKADRHYFLLKTISKQENCHLCTKQLLGILHQGYLCQHCGLLVHRQCSNLGLPDCIHSQKAKIEFKQYIFGLSLFDLMDSHEEAPELLIKAFKIIESRAKDTNEDLFEVYQLSTDTSTIVKLKEQIDQNGINLVNLEQYDLSMIGSIVKAFLRELQDSVIPEEEYSRFCNDQILKISQEEFRNMVDSINPTHLKCLKTIMKHLIWIWKYQNNHKNFNYFPDKLVSIFRTILMRPLWKNSLDSLEKVTFQSGILKRLFLDYDWGIDIPSFKERLERQSSYGFTCSLEQMLSIEEIDQQLQIYFWFWPQLTRDDTYSLLNDCKEGTFLVRKSSENRAETPYTLCILTSSGVKTIRIYYDGHFDIEKPCRFESIDELIKNYQNNSFSEHNSLLDIKLGKVFSKNKFNYERQSSVEQLYITFRDNYLKYENVKKKSDGLQSDIEALNQDLLQKNLIILSYEKIFNLYKNQIDLSLINMLPSAVDSAIFEDNVTKIQMKMIKIDEKKQEIAKDRDYINVIISQLKSEIELLRPKVIEYRKKNQNLRMFLRERGEDDEKIVKELKTHQKNSLTQLNSEEILENSETWFAPEISRNDANEILKNTQDGTFLVRKNDLSKYVLCLSLNNEIKHILIDEDSSHKCYIKINTSQFAKKFDTLTDLVLYYFQNSLKVFDNSLDTCLMYPVFGTL